MEPQNVGTPPQLSNNQNFNNQLPQKKSHKKLVIFLIIILIIFATGLLFSKGEKNQNGETILDIACTPTKHFQMYIKNVHILDEQFHVGGDISIFFNNKQLDTSIEFPSLEEYRQSVGGQVIDFHNSHVLYRDGIAFNDTTYNLYMSPEDSMLNEFNELSQCITSQQNEIQKILHGVVLHASLGAKGGVPDEGIATLTYGHKPVISTFQCNNLSQLSNQDQDSDSVEGQNDVKVSPNGIVSTIDGYMGDIIKKDGREVLVIKNVRFSNEKSIEVLSGCVRNDGKKLLEMYPVDSALQSVSNDKAAKDLLSALNDNIHNLYKDNNSYINLCSNGIIKVQEGFSYINNDIDLLKKALNVDTQQEASIKCYSSLSKYALSVKLLSSENWCVDNNGMRQGKADPVSISCK